MSDVRGTLLFVTTTTLANSAPLTLGAPKWAQVDLASRPLVKWAGGKTQLLGELWRRLPAECETYHEPFVGGGALFLSLAPRKAMLSDLNSRLIGVYVAARDSLPQLLAEIDVLEAEYNNLHEDAKQKYFYAMRAQFNQASTRSVRDAALFLFLNKAGFNGLYRENRKGEFNVPWGRRTHIALGVEGNLAAVAEALANADLRCESFQTVVNGAQAGDFVYFDPPYIPLEYSASFTAYQAGGFGYRDQQILAEVVGALTRKGVKVMLSNSHTDATREIFGEFHYETVSARRSINRDAGGRGAILEAIVRNYE